MALGWVIGLHQRVFWWEDKLAVLQLRMMATSVTSVQSRKPLASGYMLHYVRSGEYIQNRSGGRHVHVYGTAMS